MEWNIPNGRAARRVSLVAMVSAGLALAACTTMGTGSGSTATGDQPVNFSWKSRDGGVTGTMSATLPGGETFTGPYLEITSTAQSTSFFPMWSGWSAGWSDWSWGFGGPAGFQDGTTTNYTGKVVANLQGSGALRMRCRFDLNDPPAGMGGGGQGKCQVAGGATVDATFPRA
jgi:hypothetical protein